MGSRRYFKKQEYCIYRARWDHRFDTGNRYGVLSWNITSIGGSESGSRDQRTTGTTIKHGGDNYKLDSIDVDGER